MLELLYTKTTCQGLVGAPSPTSKLVRVSERACPQHGHFTVKMQVKNNNSAKNNNFAIQVLSRDSSHLNEAKSVPIISPACIQRARGDTAGLLRAASKMGRKCQICQVCCLALRSRAARGPHSAPVPYLKRLAAGSQLAAECSQQKHGTANRRKPPRACRVSRLRTVVTALRSP